MLIPFRALRHRAYTFAGLLLSLCAMVVVAQPPAEAAYPGKNGKLAFDAGSIYTVNPNGTEFTPIYFDGLWPRWSPDGARLAFAGREPDNSFDLYVANADGSELSRLTSTVSETESHPAWSPDGSKIAFVRGPARPCGLYVLDLATRTEAIVPQPFACVEAIAWSPDGSKIAFSADPDADTIAENQIWSMNPDGSELINLTSNTCRSEDLDWSPDGSRIAYDSDGAACGLKGIYIMNADGSEQTRITSPDYYSFSPGWSPDGTQIAFSASPPLGQGLYVMNVDGSGVRQLTDLDGLHVDWQSNDATAPNTLLGGFPEDNTRSTTAIFEFDSTKADSTFECTLDGSTFEPCVSPRTYAGLGDAVHEFQVRAISKFAVPDPTPAKRIWVVDTTPPVIAFLQRTSPNSLGWNNGPVTVEWSCEDATSMPVNQRISVAVVTEGRNQSASGECRDRAGNYVWDTQSGISIDLTGPSTTIAAPILPVIIGPIGVIMGQTSDNLSGAAATTVTFVSTSQPLGTTRKLTATCTFGCGTSSTTWSVSTAAIKPGFYRVTARSKDIAGNLGPASLPILILIV